MKCDMCKRRRGVCQITLSFIWDNETMGCRIDLDERTLFLCEEHIGQVKSEIRHALIDSPIYQILMPKL